PHTSRAAVPMPAAGHTELAKPGSMSNEKPIRARMKYDSARSGTRQTRLAVVASGREVIEAVPGPKYIQSRAAPLGPGAPAVRPAPRPGLEGLPGGHVQEEEMHVVLVIL